MRIWKRWGIFNLVGILGFVLQLTLLFAMKRFFSVPYLLATAIAVEAAVLHNFFWHEHFTWAEVVSPLRRGTARRLIRFHLANGLISMGANVALTATLVELLGWPYLPANAAAVLATSFLNFIAADQFVFARDRHAKCGA